MAEQNQTQTQSVTVAQTFPSMLEKYKSEVARALPAHIPPEKMLRMALTEFRKNPKLNQCEPKSVFASVVCAAQMGLEIGLPGQAYLVPYENRKSGQLECQLIPGYQGLVDIAMRSGRVKAIYANCVYKNDFFEYEAGTENKITHKPKMDGGRGPLVCVYSVAVLDNGERVPCVMTREDVEKVRNSSKGASGHTSPWTTHEEEMWKKTCLRRHYKTLPKSSEIVKAIGLMDSSERGVGQSLDIESVLTDTWAPPAYDDSDPDAVIGSATEPTATEQASANVRAALLNKQGKAGNAAVNQNTTNAPATVDGELV